MPSLIMKNKFFMRNISLLFAILSFSMFSYAQSEDAKSYFEKGNTAFVEKDYSQAIEFFTSAIALKPDSLSYYNRAIAYFYKGDECAFCNDLAESAKRKYNEAQQLYSLKCEYTEIEKQIPDSLKKCYPPVKYFELLKHKCKLDSTTVIVIQKDKYHDLSTEISKFVCLNKTEFKNRKIENGDKTLFIDYESFPEFPGGMGELMKYLEENIRYPQLAKDLGVQGKVYVNFIVQKDGSISDIKILRGLPGGCNEEAIRVVQNMPNWIPAKQREKPINVSYNLPIKFTLDKPEKKARH
jgi:TonB family protein